MTTTRSTRAAVLRFAREHDLLPPGPLLVAVSGGADSTALLLLLADLAPRLGLDLHVAHFDHRLRPGESADDARFVADLAQRHGASIRIGRADAAPKSEDEAREARYAFLRRVAGEVGAARIATGHTRDDQAETVLLHATRGSGLAGLAGMRPRRDDLVRPLLAIGRAETEAVCAEAKIAPREDRSNADLRYARTRIRHRVLPELERINPRARDALARLAEAAAEASEAERARTERDLRSSVTEAGIALARLDPERRGAVLALAWQRRTGRTLTARHRAALAALAASTDGTATLDLPGGPLVREYGLVRFDVAPPPAAGNALRLELGRPVRWSGWTIVLASGGAADLPLRAPAPDRGPLLVRARRPGDRLAGPVRTRVQDLFTDAKLPVRLRGSHPVVATEAGEIWWVVGLRHAGGAPSGDRWLFAAPPAEHSWSSARYTGSIETHTA